MKTEEKNTVTYRCEVCGYASSDKASIERCEEGHKCSHAETTIQIEASDFYEGAEFSFTKVCSQCKRRVGHIRLLEVLDGEEEVMADILKLLEEKYPQLVEWK